MAAGIKIDENTDGKPMLIGGVKDGIVFLEANMKDKYKDMYQDCLNLLTTLKEHEGEVREDDNLYRRYMVVGRMVNYAIKGRI